MVRRETRYSVTVRGQVFPVTIREEADELEVRLDGHVYAVDLRRARGTPGWSLLIDHVPHKAVLVNEGERFFLDLDGVSEHVEIGTERDEILRRFAPAKVKREGSLIVRSPMPGLVVALRVATGDRIAAGESVATVEAMKMENEFKAPEGGVVEAIHAKPGDTVAKGAPLVTIRLS